MKSTDGPRNQNIETPLELIAAVERRFGPIGWDLAATKESRKGPRGNPGAFYGPGSEMREDALSDDCYWGVARRGEIAWLNPPWKRCSAFAHKAALTPLVHGSAIAYLGPAAVCTQYFREWIAPHAYVLELVERPFKTEARDCILAIYTPQRFTGRESWSWKP